MIAWIVRRRAALLLAVGAVGVAVALYALAGFASDNRRALNDICAQSQREQAKAVLALTNTYQYLDSISFAETQTPLNQFVIRNLPRTEDEARTNIVPRYCAPPKQPVKPPRRRDYSYLILKK